MSKNSTPLPAVNRMVEMAEQIVSDSADAAPLKEFVQARLEELQQGREAFERKLSEHDEEFELEHQDEVNNALDGFDDYEAAMNTMLSFFEEEDVELLKAANEALLKVAEPLHLAMQAYARAELAWGPSDYDEMNAVCQVLRAIVDGKATATALEELVAVCCETSEKAIAEIDANEELLESEGFQAKKKAYQELIRAFSELQPVLDEEDIPDAIRPLQLALEAKTFAEQKIFNEEVVIKPTNMPAANVLIGALRGALDGQWTMDVVDEALEWYKDYVEEIEDAFDEAMEGETNSLTITEELPRTREIIDIHDEIMDRLEEALDDDFTEEAIEAIIEDFMEIVERLEESTDVYLVAAAREGQIVCIKCGHSNPPVNRSCESCGVRLPKIIDPTQYTATFELEERSGLDDDVDNEDDYHMGVNTYRLFEACYLFFEKQIPAKEFQEHIDKSRATLVTSERGIEELTGMEELNERQLGMITPEELESHRQNQEMFAETKELLEEGIEEWDTGLDYLEEFISTRRRHTMELGIQKIFVASQKIHKVQKLGEVAAEALAELDAKIRQEWKEEEEEDRREEAELWASKKKPEAEPESEDPEPDGTLA